MQHTTTRYILTLGLLAMSMGIAWSQEGSETPSTPQDQQLLQLMEAGEFEQAIALLEQMRDEDQAQVVHLALLGGLYVEMGDPESALQTLEPLAAVENADPAVLYNTGRAASALGKIEAAYGYYSRSAAAAPGSPAERELGLLLSMAGQYEKAYPYLRRWISSYPEDEQVRLVAALTAVQLVRPSEALAFVTPLDPDRPQVRLLTGRAQLLLADPQAAIDTLEPLMAAPPPQMEVDIRRTLAEAKATIGQAAEAVELLAGHVGEDPSAILQLGLAQYQSGNLDGALETLGPLAMMLVEGVNAGQDLPPGDATAVGLVREYGRLLVTAGRHEEALPYLQLSSQLEPENKQVWQQLGQALAATGDREAALEAVQKFRDIVENEVPASLKEMELKKDLEDPTSRELRQAMTLASQGQHDQALEVVRREAGVAPQDIRPPLMEVKILLMADQPLEAYALADQLVQAVPESADAVYVRGTAAMGLEDLETAEADLRRALEIFPEHTAAMNDLAVLLMERGDTAEAKQLLQRVLELRPGDALAASNLESLE